LDTLASAAMLRFRGRAGLIPICKVYDLALDPSGPARDFGTTATVYMWTRKSDGMQYVGSTENTKNCFGKKYNSPSYLRSKTSPINTAILNEGRSAFYVTILAEVSVPLLLLPTETLWIHIMDSQFNKALIGGSNKVLRTPMVKPKILATAVNPLASFLGQDHKGKANPFYGKTHSDLSKEAISRIHGTATFVYIVDSADGLTPVGKYSSARRASAGVLAELGVGVSRVTIVKYTKRFDAKLPNRIFVTPSGMKLIFTTKAQS